MKDFSEEFPALQRFTYLNTAASGLLPERVRRYREDHDLEFFHSGSIFRDRQEEELAAVREAVGRLFHCSANRVALTPNFSYGFNILMEGVKQPRKVLLLEDDYPSVNWAVQSRNFEVITIPIDQHLESRIAETVARERPEIFAFSLVQWISGIAVDLEFLKDLKRQYPNLLLFGDGTQFFGTKGFNFEQSALDVVGGSTYKWMNAGYGNAFFLFKEHMEEEILPKALGFNSLQGKYKPHQGSLIGKFEPGHQDTLNFGSLRVAVELIESIGFSTIESRIRTLSAKARAAFEQEGLLDLSTLERPPQSNIFNIKGDDQQLQQLHEQGILCSRRGDGIRVSVHYFNKSEDLNRLLEVLRKA